MSGVEVSPWTLRYVAVALASFLLAQLLVVSGLSYPAMSIQTPTTLVTVHLLTIGWLTVMMLGVLHQFVPVIGSKRLRSLPASGVTFWLVVVGFALMLGGFLFMGPLLPIGGSLVVLGVLVAVWNIGATLVRSRPLRLPALYVAASLGFLCLTVLLGLSFAIALTLPGVFTASATAVLLWRGLPLHLLGGVGGWFALTAMGVGDRLLAMFALAPEDRGATRRLAFYLSTVGIAAAWLSGLSLMFVQNVVLSYVGDLGWALLLCGVALYLADMRTLYRRRRRRELEANAAFGLVSVWALAAATLLTAGVGAFGRFASLAPALLYVLVFGWLSGLALSQIYKIVPFLTWLERYGTSLGKMKVPRVQDLVAERRARPMFWAYFAGAAIGTAGMFFAAPWLVRSATAVMLLATAGIARELWLVRHPPAHRSNESPDAA